MFDKINLTIREIEDIEEELQILLNMHKISLIEYIMIKRGSADFPAHLDMWKLEQIDDEVNKLREKINDLNKIKKEYLVW